MTTRRICPRCEGTGKHHRDSEYGCEDCDGDGRVSAVVPALLDAVALRAGLEPPRDWTPGGDLATITIS